MDGGRWEGAVYPRGRGNVLQRVHRRTNHVTYVRHATVWCRVSAVFVILARARRSEDDDEGKGKVSSYFLFFPLPLPLSLAFLYTIDCTSYWESVWRNCENWIAIKATDITRKLFRQVFAKWYILSLDFSPFSPGAKIFLQSTHSRQNKVYKNVLKLKVYNMNIWSVLLCLKIVSIHMLKENPLGVNFENTSEISKYIYFWNTLSGLLIWEEDPYDCRLYFSASNTLEGQGFDFRVIFL